MSEVTIVIADDGEGFVNLKVDFDPPVQAGDIPKDGAERMAVMVIEMIQAMNEMENQSEH